MGKIIRQSPYHCVLCHFYCNTAGQFRNHLLSSSHQKASEPDENYWCVFCSFLCKDQDLLLKHIEGEEHQEVIRAINGSMPIIIRSPKV